MTVPCAASVARLESGERRRRASEFRLALELFLVFEAIVAGKPAHDGITLPFVQDPADVLARDSGHCGEVALAHLLMDQDASGAYVASERLREAEQRPRHSTFQ